MSRDDTGDGGAGGGGTGADSSVRLVVSPVPCASCGTGAASEVALGFSAKRSPQLVQKVASSRFSAPHRGQFILFPPSV
jgi:hypothetical protein